MSFDLTKSCQERCFGCKAVTKVENRDQPLYAVGVMGGMGGWVGVHSFSPIIADSVALQGVAGG